MTTTDQQAARQQIDQRLREDAAHYDYDSLADRFEDALDDALRHGNSKVTIKIPSGSEFSIPLEVAIAAAGGTR